MSFADVMAAPPDGPYYLHFFALPRIRVGAAPPQVEESIVRVTVERRISFIFTELSPRIT